MEGASDKLGPRCRPLVAEVAVGCRPTPHIPTLATRTATSAGDFAVYASKPVTMPLLCSSSTKMCGSALRAGAPARTCVLSAAHVGPSSRRVLDFAPSCPWTRSTARKVVCMAAGAAATIPSVRIDNVHDPFATLVTVDMGSAIEMLETVSARRSHRLLTVSC